MLDDTRVSDLPDIVEIPDFDDDDRQDVVELLDRLEPDIEYDFVPVD